MSNTHFVGFALVSFISLYSAQTTDSAYSGSENWHLRASGTPPQWYTTTQAPDQGAWLDELSDDVRNIVDIFYEHNSTGKASLVQSGYKATGVHMIDLMPWFSVEFAVTGDVYRDELRIEAVMHVGEGEMNEWGSINHNEIYFDSKTSMRKTHWWEDITLRYFWEVKSGIKNAYWLNGYRTEIGRMFEWKGFEAEIPFKYREGGEYRRTGVQSEAYSQEVTVRRVPESSTVNIERKVVIPASLRTLPDWDSEFVSWTLLFQANGTSSLSIKEVKEYTTAIKDGKDVCKHWIPLDPFPLWTYGKPPLAIPYCQKSFSITGNKNGEKHLVYGKEEVRAAYDFTNPTQAYTMKLILWQNKDGIQQKYMNMNPNIFRSRRKSEKVSWHAMAVHTFNGFNYDPLTREMFSVKTDLFTRGLKIDDGKSHGKLLTENGKIASFQVVGPKKYHEVVDAWNLWTAPFIKFHNNMKKFDNCLSAAEHVEEVARNVRGGGFFSRGNEFFDFHPVIESTKLDLLFDGVVNLVTSLYASSVNQRSENWLESDVGKRYSKKWAEKWCENRGLIKAPLAVAAEPNNWKIVNWWKKVRG